MSSDFRDDLTEQDRADLAALADGSLPPARRTALEAKIARSARLQSLLAEQRRAVSAIRAGFEPAPQRLRDGLHAEARKYRSRRRIRLGVGFTSAAGALAAAAVVLAISLSGGPQPTVAQFARLATSTPTAAAPMPASGTPTLLNARVDRVAYPNWAQLGWQPTGMRTDRLDGRSATTVFYRNGTQVLGYTIVAGPALSPPQQAISSSVIDHTEFRGFTSGVNQAVTWQRGGHTCVIAGTGVDPGTLVSLAAWNGDGPGVYG